MPASRGYAEKSRSILLSLVVDFVLLLPDIVAAVMASSITLLADVLKCATELLATFLAWLTIVRVARNKHHVYNYGIGKLENLSSLIVAGFMLVSLLIVLVTAVERLRHPQFLHPGGLWLGSVMMTLGVVVNTWLWFRNRTVARRAYSPVMESQWRLFRAKAFSDGTVLLALVLSHALRGYAWSAYIDPAASFVIVGFLVFSVYSVVAHTVYDLMDRTLEEELQMIIVRELVAFFDEYVKFHGVRSRRSGGDIFIEIFLEFDGARSMAEVQVVIDRLRDSLEQKIGGSQVVVSPSTRPLPAH